MDLPAAFLTLPAPGDRAFAGLERKVRLLALRTLLTWPAHHLPGPRGPALRRVQAVLSEVARRHKRGLLQALARPDVLPPLLVLRAQLRPPGPLLDLAVPALLIALSEARALPESLVWPGPLHRVAGTGGLHTFDPPAEALLAAPGLVELRLPGGQLVPLADRPASRPVHGLRPGLHLAPFDTNPLADIEDHPDKDGNAVDLGGRAASDWGAALGEALDLVAQALPGWMAELPVSLRRVVPVGWEPERHLSASYREAPGLCYLSLHPDPLTLAEALVHETQHGKLGVLLHLDAVLHNGRTTWTASPVRPDLRPLMGVLLAVHAFVPVAALHARLAAADHPLARTARFDLRRREVLAGNARGLALVEDQGEPTAIGARLTSDLQRLHDVLAAQVPDLTVAPDAVPPG